MKTYIVILSIIVLLFSEQVSAQIGIYTETPHTSAILDITANSKGVLLPRMTTAQKQAIETPANSLLVYDTDLRCLSQNLGTEVSPVWTCITKYNNHFFYMPSVNISTVTLGAASLDLYGVYKSQFVAPQQISTSAPTTIPYFRSATDLFYYVTYHDPTLLNIKSIDENGVMSYTVLRRANYDAYMNVIFMVK